MDEEPNCQCQVGNDLTEANMTIAFEAGLYGYRTLVMKSGITAAEAAEVILRENHKLAVLYSVQALVGILSTKDELDSDRVCHHHLSVWLNRAREKAIEYRPALDWSVERYSSDVSKPVDHALTGALDDVVTATRDCLTSKGDKMSGGIPGKLPTVAIGKLAISAAWQIEGETGRAATCDSVMQLLQQWADDGSKPETLRISVKSKNGVEWVTKKGKPKQYDREACGKTLATWAKSRA